VDYSDSPLLEALTFTALRRGRDLDVHADATGALSTLSLDAGMALGSMYSDGASNFERPRVLAEGPHWFALVKPPYWTVSVSGEKEDE